ncbi:MAG: DUF4860 domain-containing protein [Bacillota bacterium]|nr:DUF4860 domain-containing protein [Bacillota bacterium]
MRRETAGKKYISGISVLTVLGIFAICVLIVILTGAKIYKDVYERDSRSFEQLTAVRYITTKVRQAPDSDGIFSVSLEGTDALAMKEFIDGEEYCTLIYCREGWLCEYFGIIEGDDFSQLKDSGERVVRTSEFHPEIDRGMLTVKLAFERDGENPEETVFNIYLRGSGEDDI